MQNTKVNNSLAREYGMGGLIKFAVPNMIMMVFLSFYCIVDGMFISRFAGTTALSAVNIVYPAISVEMAAGVMLATGGSAIVARKLGEGKGSVARANMSLLILVEVLLGVLTAVFGNLFIEPLIHWMGASSAQMEMCRQYLSVILWFAPGFFLQVAFQTFFVTAGKPALGLTVTVMAGITNAVLDYVFLGPLGMGIGGAALATGLGYCVSAVAGVAYFMAAKKNELHFVKPLFDKRMLAQSCLNGSSEMVTNLANAVTTFLFNIIFMRYYAEDGVAAITIVLYFQFTFTAIFFGYANGVAPLISYKYGSGDRRQLRSIFKNSLVFIGICSVFSYILSVCSIRTVLSIFTPAGSNVYNIALDGFMIYAAAFLLMGIGIFASALFTALSDGKTSALISFARTFIFLEGAILLLPALFGGKAVWFAVPTAEALGLLVAVICMATQMKKYLGNGPKKKETAPSD